MPTPSSSLATLRPELGGALMDFDLEADRLGFIGHRVLRPLSVDKQAGPFGRVPIGELLKNAETMRAPDGSYTRSTAEFGTDSYATLENGHEVSIDDRFAGMYASYFDQERFSVDRARDVVLRKAERRIAALVFNAATWTGSALTSGAGSGLEWSDTVNAVPITDVMKAKQKVFDGTGMWPNAAILNRTVFHNLRENAQIRDRIASSGAGESTKASKVTIAQIAAVFDLDHLLVAGSAKNTANEAQAVAIAQIWSGEFCMVCKLAETDDPMEPVIGRSLHWSADGSDIGATVETYRDEPKRADIVRARHDTDEKILLVAAGHLISNITE